MNLDFLPDQLNIPVKPSAYYTGRPERKIDDDRMLELIDEGLPQKVVAERLGVSPAAVCKRLAKLRPAPAEPLPFFDALKSDKERQFVVELAGGVSQTEAASRAYDTTSRESAAVVGSQLMQRPGVREALEEIMNREGLTRSHLIRRLKQHVDGKDPATSIRATEIGLKAHGELVEKRMNLNVNIEAIAPVDLSRYRNQ